MRMKLVFAFSGHGTQRWNMARQLFEKEPAFVAAVERCDSLLSQYVTWSLTDELLADESRSRLDSDNIEIIQPALFTVQVALSKLWRSWGIEPDAVVGHSMGEVAAAYVAGIISLSDAIRLIVLRSRLLYQGLRLAAKHGAMAWVKVARGEVDRLLAGYEGQVWVAAQNSPETTVLSGDALALKSLLESLKRRKIAYRMMRIPGAGHTPQIELVASELVRALDGLCPRPQRIPMFSTLTGLAVDSQNFDAKYWGLQIKEPVLFSEAIGSLVKHGYKIYLEISPEPILASSISQCLRYSGQGGIVLASLRRNQPDLEVMFESLSTLYAAGALPKVGLPAKSSNLDSAPMIILNNDSMVSHENRLRNGLNAGEPPVLTDETNTFYPERRVVPSRRLRPDRRSGLERRKTSLPNSVFELRSGKDRRTGVERRLGKDRRAALG